MIERYWKGVLLAFAPLAFAAKLLVSGTSSPVDTA